MLKFTEENARYIGRVEFRGITVIADGTVMSIDDVLSPDLEVAPEPLFMIEVYFDSATKYCIDELPTGLIEPPMMVGPIEYIVTDGIEKWWAARHRTAEHLQLSDEESDSNLYVLNDGDGDENNELPERLRILTTKDKERMVEKIQKFCKNIN